MLLSRVIGVMVLWLGVLVFMAHENAADPLGHAVIGVVDVQHILQNAQAAQKIHLTIEEQRQIYSTQIAQQEEALRTAEQELRQQQQVLSQEEFINKRHELEQQIMHIRDNVEQHRNQLSQLFIRSMSHIRTTLLNLITEIAETKGLTLVLFKHQVIVVDQSLDITALVLEQLNERLPQVDSTVSQSEELETESQ